MMATPDRYLGISSHPESHECAGFNFEKSYSEFTRSTKVHFSFRGPAGGSPRTYFSGSNAPGCHFKPEKTKKNDRPDQKIIRTKTMGPKGSRQDLTRPGHKAAKFILGWLCAACGFQKNKLREPSPPLGGEPVGLGLFFFQKEKFTRQSKSMEPNIVELHEYPELTRNFERKQRCY